MAINSAGRSPKLWWDFRYIWMFISTIWVFTLASGVIRIWQERRFVDPWPNSQSDVILSPTWVQILATILVVAFIALYVAIMYRMYFGRSTWVSDISSRERWTTRVPILLIAVALVFLPYEDRLENWPFVFVFVVIAWTITAGPNSAFSAVVISTAGTALILSLAYDSGVILDIPIYALAFGFFTSGYVINRGLINELRLEQSRVRDQAVTDERFRFARDLHDTVGHSMTQITLKAELARRIIGNDLVRAAKELAEIESLSRDLSAQIRQSIAGEVDLTIEQELDRAAALLESMGVILDRRIQVENLPTHVDAALAWCTREGVMNVIKHSGATNCIICLQRMQSEFVLTITDNGSKTDLESTGGQGVDGMKSRLQSMGGRVMFSPIDDGHKLEVRIPV